MRRINLGRRSFAGIVAIAAVVAIPVAASASDGQSHGARAGAGQQVKPYGPYGATLKSGAYGEHYTPSASVLQRAFFGPKSLPSDTAQKNVVLAAMSRVKENLTPAQMQLAMKCWKNNGCSTGHKGITVAEADGFGSNSSRETVKMEFILQALTYPSIGKIIYTDANLNTEKAISDMNSLIAQGAKVILSYPDAGAAMLPSYRAAEAQGDQVGLWSNADIGTPGTDYMTSTGTDICGLGQQYAAILNKQLPKGGQVAFLGGTPGNTQSPAWQACEKKALNKNIQVVATQNTNWTRQGAFQATSAIISKYPKLKGISYDYGDATVGIFRAFESAKKSLKNFIITDYSNENSMLCAYKKMNIPSLKIWTYVGLSPQGRIILTAGMMKNAGASIPSQILFKPFLKRVTLNSCQKGIPVNGNPTSLVPAALQRKMFG